MNKDEGVFCYDISLIPDGLCFADIFNIMNKSKFLFYDSFNAVSRGFAPTPPYLLKGKSDKIVVDVSNPAYRKKFDKLLKEIRNDNPKDN
jgi:hypothetical protein